MNKTAGARAAFRKIPYPPTHAGHSVADERSRGRRAELVGDDAQFAALAREPRDGAQEVLPLGRIDPGGAHDQERAAGAADFVLAGKLGRAVDGQGPRRIVLAPGRAPEPSNT